MEKMKNALKALKVRMNATYYHLLPPSACGISRNGDVYEEGEWEVMSEKKTKNVTETQGKRTKKEKTKEKRDRRRRSRRREMNERERRGRGRRDW